MTKTKKLDKKTSNEMKDLLLEEKKNLEKELEKFARKDPHDPDGYQTEFVDIGSDETDSTSEVAKFSLDISLEATLEKSLRDVNQALERIESGEYGICKYCNKPIDVERLKARPTSSACVACKTRLKGL